MITKNIKKYIFIALGTIALVLGVVGIFIPFLPTTPFLLVTAFFYLRSSESLYHWLINHRVLGRYVSDYLKYRAVSRKTKIVALATLWPSLGMTIYFVPLLPVKILLASIGTVVSVHIIRLKERP